MPLAASVSFIFTGMLPASVSLAISDFFTAGSGKPSRIDSAIPVGGGCINEAVRIQTDSGEYFVKFNLEKSFPGMFEAEAHGLSILDKANEIRIPDVLHTGNADKYSFLLLEFISDGNPAPKFWEKFGRSLAGLHRHSSKLFGLDRDNYIGSLPQSNIQHESWTDFFVTERLEPMVKMGRDKSEISPQMVKQFESIYNKLPALVPPEKPSLIHGDLWNGNFLVDSRGNPCLFDPAVHFGHRESDIAMTRLFGGFPALFYESYNSQFPMEKGWEQRMELLNLYPLMVHVNLFGGGYLNQVKQVILKFS